MQRSVLVGDKGADLIAGRSAGVRTNVLFGARPDSCESERPDLAVSSLTSLIDLLRNLSR